MDGCALALVDVVCREVPFGAPDDPTGLALGAKYMCAAVGTAGAACVGAGAVAVAGATGVSVVPAGGTAGCASDAAGAVAVALGAPAKVKPCPPHPSPVMGAAEHISGKAPNP